MSVAAPVKDYLKTWCEATICADFAERIAAEIETSIVPCSRQVCDQAFCWTCRSNAYAEGLAAMVRRLGGVV